eukprot:CAMPEP_0202039776 /NCGR_PEP_ID=MMETSP0962-20130828/17839_1 /ASSEMBLY_ACC=CAM_ASM_000488 /TAXON_ID=4773 /ORGANISM="Schizochytrium aggregatum, Strain ATCC28209" /LENGTH=73 /DNA_ID=CAMNT_0048604011 /DNA_START=87 /DNA_END=305 /DNA_ORIENTATION=-
MPRDIDDLADELLHNLLQAMHLVGLQALLVVLAVGFAIRAREHPRATGAVQTSSRVIQAGPACCRGCSSATSG